MNFFHKYSNQITGYLFITPAVLLISLFGIFPVFFGFYMSFHKWKVFKGRFLGFENYQIKTFKKKSGKIKSHKRIFVCGQGS